MVDVAVIAVTDVGDESSQQISHGSLSLSPKVNFGSAKM